MEFTDGRWVHRTGTKIMAFLGDHIDYSNFKDEIDGTPNQKHKPYHEVWSVLARALGAYGSKGQV